MFVHIVPIKRMPRGLDVFDYHIPDELVESICPGQLVTVPLRKSTIHGLVFSLPKKESDSPTDTIKPITSIVQTEPIVSPLQLKHIRTMSEWYGVSFGTIANMCLLPMQKRKLKKMILSPLPKKKQSASAPPPTYHHYTSEKERAGIIKNIVAGQTLILVPEVRMIDDVIRLLPKKDQQDAIAWHSSLSTKEQFERWLMIRNNEKRVIVATRGGVFLPFTQLKHILVDAEHHDQHKHWDQAPRFHAKDVAAFLAKTFGATLHLASYTPSVESYYHIHKGQYKNQTPPALTAADATVVDMSDERRGKNFSLFSGLLEDALLEAKKDVFLFINRLGYATSVGCHDCGHTELCATCQTPLVYHDETKKLHCHYCKTYLAIPLRCPTCGSTMVRLRGIGTEQVETLVRNMLGDKLRHTVVRIDSLSQVPDTRDKKPMIIIGTEMALAHVRWEQTELIAFLDIDKQLLLPEYTAGEHVWHLIHTVLFQKKSSSTFFIQTFNPKQLVIKSLKEPDRFYRTDLNHRRPLGYPPYQYLVRYFVGHEQEYVAKQQVDAVRAHLERSLTPGKKNDILSHSIEMHPRFYRKKYWYMILVKLPADSWQEDLKRINNIIPKRGWRIDPNPISILSP